MLILGEAVVGVLRLGRVVQTTRAVRAAQVAEDIPEVAAVAAVVVVVVTEAATRWDDKDKCNLTIGGREFLPHNRFK